MISSMGGGAPSGPPLGIEQITREASEFEYNDFVHLRNWLRTARQLRQQAEIYEAEGNLQEAYLLYYRQAVLVLQHLPSHPEVKASATNRNLLRVAKKDVEISLNCLEKLKPLVKDEHERYQKRQEVAAQRKREAEKRSSNRAASRPSSGQSIDSNQTGSLYQHPYNPVYYDGHQHRDVALQVAQKVQGYRHSTDRQRQTPVQDPGVQDYNLSQDMQNIRLRLDGKTRSATNRGQISEARDGRVDGLSTAYPSVPSARATPTSTLDRQWYEEADHRSDSLAAPSLPKKVPIQANAQAPILPPKGPDPSSHTEYAQRAVDESVPILPPKTKELDTAPAVPQQVFKPSAYLENSVPLRTVFFPPGMRRDFLNIAKQNTSKKLETCGILCGFLKNNALFVSSLVIPEQTSTSDYCEMTDEGEIALFDWVDGHELLTLGWIHTHPTQTCFMSSRDLHTHCGYQSMIQESIAVVCAPSIFQSNGESEYGIFRLTDPPGMPTIRRCTDTRVFHPHDVDNLYTDCQRPGHVVELDGLAYQVFDLRSGKK